MITAVYILDKSKGLIDSLNSVKDRVDEIICIVDTRCQDNTFEICKQYTDKVYMFEWLEQDFSKARNYGIDKATNDWILTIDGDETLKSIEQPSNEFDFYVAKIINNLDGHDREHLSVRLFKKSKDIYYEGLKHETVELCLKRINAKSGQMDLKIRHTGYNDLTPEEWETKVTGLLETHIEQLRREPDNPKIYYNIAKCYYSLKEYQLAIDYGVLSLFKPLINIAKAETCLILYFCYKKLDKLDIAINWLIMSGEIVPSCLASANLVNFYKTIDKDLMISELKKLKQLSINGTIFPNDIKIKTESIDQKLKEALSGL